MELSELVWRYNCCKSAQLVGIGNAKDGKYRLDNTY